MSLIRSKAIQMGYDATPSNNFLIYQPLTPDGTFRIANGNQGATTDIMTVSSTGNVTFAGSTNFASLNFGSGSVTAPSLYPTGDSNTGLFFPAADTVGITTGGTERVRIDSNGLTLAGGVANGVAYLNGSKVLTTGSALTFDGTNLSVGGFANFSTSNLTCRISSNSTAGYLGDNSIGNGTGFGFNSPSAYLYFQTYGSEQMRLTSTGLGIGTNSPSAKLQVAGKGNGVTSGYNGEVFFGDNAAFQGRVSYDGFTGTTALYIDNTYDNADAKIQFRMRTAGTPVTALTINGSGNLGLGVTPSAWSVYKAYQVGRGALVNATTETDLMHNAYWNGSNWIYVATDFASRHSQINGQHRFYTAPSGTAGNAISFTQAMTLDASGNLKIGRTDGSYRLEVSAATEAFRISGAGTSAQYQTFNTSGGNYYVGISSSGGGGLLGGASAYSMCLVTESARDIIFGTNNTERMRIDSSGNLLVGTTSTNAGTKFTVYQASATTHVGEFKNGANGYGLLFYNTSNSIVGSITWGATATTYSTSSDYRLKENIQPMQGALDVVAQLNPVTYTWKADGSDGQGFIAHELQAVVPDCVTGEKDAVDEEGKPVYQGVDTSFLVATLTKAIQEQQELIESLKARLDAAGL